MPEELLPKPLTDLPLPEKQIPANLALQGEALQNPKRRFHFPKYIFLGIIFVIFLSIIGGAYLIGRNSVYKELNPTSPAIPPADPDTYNPSPTPASSPSADMSNWKTYTNGKFGFTFKYPNNWQITAPSGPTPKPYQDLNVGLAPSSKVKTGKEYVISVDHYENPNNLSFQDWDKKQNGESPRGFLLYSSSTKPANLPSLTAYINDEGDCSPVICKEVIIMGDKKVIILRNLDFSILDYTKEEIESYKPIFDQILSSFTFN